MKRPVSHAALGAAEEAESVAIGHLEGASPPSICVVLNDAAGKPFAVGYVSPQVARNIAAQLLEHAAAAERGGRLAS